jgi:hypothetical protein
MDSGAKPVDTGIVLSTTDIDADHAALKAAGVDVDPEIARWGAPVPPMFRLRDPAGNSLTIVEPIEYCPAQRRLPHRPRASSARSVPPRMPDL